MLVEDNGGFFGLVVQHIKCTGQGLIEGVYMGGILIKEFLSNSPIDPDWEIHMGLGEVVYLPRTEGVSTTKIKEDLNKVVV